MTKHKTDTEKTKAYNLYLTGLPITRIAEKTGVHRQSIMDWREKHNWTQRKQTIDEEAQHKLDKNLTNIKAQGVRMFRKMLTEYEKKVKKGFANPKPADAVTVHKHLLHLHGEAETTIKEIKTETELNPEEIEKQIKKIFENESDNPPNTNTPEKRTQ